MESKCQSCGMPMVKKEDFGTDADGGRNDYYCRFCFSGGKFTAPGMTMEQMIEKVTRFAEKMNMNESQARSMANSTIPKLKRWNAERVSERT